MEPHPVWRFLATLDRRWLFGLTIFVVGIPLMTGIVLTQKPSPMVIDVFNAIDDLPEGSSVLLPLDFDPSAEGELQPMAEAFTRHCAEKKHKLYYLTIWPQGVGMIQRQISILSKEYPDYKNGVDYVNLGYRPGYEVVINTIVNDFPGLYDADQNGNPVSTIPMMKGIKNIRGFPLIVNVSAGDPGLKQWIQYAATPFDTIEIVGGTTGVQASTLYPYIPRQMIGMLAGIKPAAEYEELLFNKYPEIAEKPKTNTASVFMTAQEAAHFMLIGIIILGNLVMWQTDRKGASE
ncbi:MAG TPA: hypothetical protein VMM56_14585 [Planctomycetaceae bacterium]|nr:hypothetical protein [Planctomycetaceae bacterium]